LEERIRQSGLTKSYIAKVLGIDGKTLKNKLKGRTQFKESEMNAMWKLLGITDPAEKIAIFFADEVA
jgi:hypothetical protein